MVVVPLDADGAEVLEVLEIVDDMLGLVDVVRELVNVVLGVVDGVIIDGAEVVLDAVVGENDDIDVAGAGVDVMTLEERVLGKRVLPEANNTGVPVAVGNVAGSCCCPRAPRAADHSSNKMTVTIITNIFVVLGFVMSYVYMYNWNFLKHLVKNFFKRLINCLIIRKI
jgi:hypothetical protein